MLLFNWVLCVVGIIRLHNQALLLAYRICVWILFLVGANGVKRSLRLVSVQQRCNSYILVRNAIQGRLFAMGFGRIQHDFAWRRSE